MVLQLENKGIFCMVIGIRIGTRLAFTHLAMLRPIPIMEDGIGLGMTQATASTCIPATTEFLSLNRREANHAYHGFPQFYPEKQ